MNTYQNGHSVIIDPQPIAICEPSFVYQLSASLEEGGVNLWSGNLNPNNGFVDSHAIKAAKLFAAAEDMLAALKMVDTTVEEHLKGYTKEQFTHSMRDWHRAVKNAIAKAD